jgi:uncharacterized protein
MFRIAALLLLLWSGALPAGKVDVPYLTGRVTDNAELLRPETREQIAQRLAAHERAGNQVAC